MAENPIFRQFFAQICPKNFLSKIGLRNILSITILHHCAKNQRILMSQSREKLVTDGRTNERTNRHRLIYRTSLVGPKIKNTHKVIMWYSNAVLCAALHYYWRVWSFDFKVRSWWSWSTKSSIPISVHMAWLISSELDSISMIKFMIGYSTWNKVETKGKHSKKTYPKFISMMS